ncbi:UNVERIFIED_CONTAM: Desiccation-related protein PCC13-62 [Sesamum calycinum]|uniref:Desiccation-related protein PCC13-62 n=1 Tax=Sesamum calycinum TaxID=2727403 RepID=A0AAW2JZR2_9LAMI
MSSVYRFSKAAFSKRDWCSCGSVVPSYSTMAGVRQFVSNSSAITPLVKGMPACSSTAAPSPGIEHLVFPFGYSSRVSHWGLHLPTRRSGDSSTGGASGEMMILRVFVVWSVDLGVAVAVDPERGVNGMLETTCRAWVVSLGVSLPFCLFATLVASRKLVKTRWHFSQLQPPHSSPPPPRHLHRTRTNTKLRRRSFGVPLELGVLGSRVLSFAAYGRGLDSIAPNLTLGGPRWAIQSTVRGFPRPLLNISAESFATVINQAFGQPLRPPFDPYANDINYLIASYLIPYVGLTGYVGANPNLQSTKAKSLVAGLLGVESGQDAVIRTLLYERASLKVRPYPFTVAEFSTKISNLRNKLGKEGVKDEGLIVEPAAGAEGRISGNVLSADKDSLAYARTPEEVLRIVYGSGQANVTGGFYPRGGNGRIARSYLPS